LAHLIKIFKFVLIGTVIISFFSCVNKKNQSNHADEEINIGNSTADDNQISYKDQFAFFNGDPYLFIFVDKKNELASDYEPQDLVKLKSGHLLRAAAAASLEQMSAAAAQEGLNLVVSSAYRSYKYQAEVFARNVKAMGEYEANRVSARPGQSQHQLGLVVDFGSITNEFARTREGIWVYNNASRFGWSLSYPQGYEELTGYSWESWHYRYVGKELAEFIDTYFDGIQHNALEFIQETQKNNTIVSGKDFIHAIQGGIIIK